MPTADDVRWLAWHEARAHAPDQSRGPRPRRRLAAPRPDRSRAVLEPARRDRLAARPGRLRSAADRDRSPSSPGSTGSRTSGRSRATTSRPISPSASSRRLRGPRRRAADGVRPGRARSLDGTVPPDADGGRSRSSGSIGWPATRPRRRPRALIARSSSTSFAVEPERRVAIELETVLGLTTDAYHAILVRVDGRARRASPGGRPSPAASYLSSIGTAPELPRPRAGPARRRRSRSPMRSPTAAAGSTSACSRRTTSPSACTARSGSSRSAASRRTCCSGRDVPDERISRPASCRWRRILGDRRAGAGPRRDLGRPTGRRRRARSPIRTSAPRCVAPLERRPDGAAGRRRRADDRGPPRRDARPPRRGPGRRLPATAPTTTASMASARRAAAAGIALSRVEPGPFGPSVLVLGRPVTGPHLIVVERRTLPSPP